MKVRLIKTGQSTSTRVFIYTPNGNALITRLPRRRINIWFGGINKVEALGLISTYDEHGSSSFGWYLNSLVREKKDTGYSESGLFSKEGLRQLLHNGGVDVYNIEEVFNLIYSSATTKRRKKRNG